MTVATAPVRSRRKRKTRHVLWRLLTGLLITTVVVFGTTLWAFHRVHDTADTVHSRTAPAILELTLARAALEKADNAAINSFRTGESQLTGPGAEYQNQIAIASQNLTQVAEHNAAGDAGSRTLQLVNGLLVTYTSLVGQADAHYRQDAGSVLGTTDLWYASRLLHTSRSGILAQLDFLLDSHKRALEDQLTTSAVSPWTVLAWGAPIVGLFGLLITAQVMLKNRFRRVWNRGLLAATVALAGLSVVASLVFVSDSRLDKARDTLYQTVDDWRAQTFVTESEGQQALATLVRDVCGQPDTCGETVALFVADLEHANTTGGVDDSRLTAGTETVNDQTEAAGANGGFEFLIYVLAALIGISVLFGFRGRIDEYRYRPR